MPSETRAFAAFKAEMEEKAHADDERLRRHYAAQLGILDPEDSTPCWDEIIDAAVASGREQAQAYVADAVSAARQAGMDAQAHADQDTLDHWAAVLGVTHPDGSAPDWWPLLEAARESRWEVAAIRWVADWTRQYGTALCPPAGCADTFGEGMRAAKQHVANRICAPGPDPVVEILSGPRRPRWLSDLLATALDAPAAVRVVLMAPPGRQRTILDVTDELFNCGALIHWIEADTPYGRRLIALLTDS